VASTLFRTRVLLTSFVGVLVMAIWLTFLLWIISLSRLSIRRVRGCQIDGHLSILLDMKFDVEVEVDDGNDENETDEDDEDALFSPSKSSSKS